jgi:NAD(P) transhydrogenase subunit alpha
MIIAVPRESHPGETRIAMIPEHVAKLTKAGAKISIESGLGQSLRLIDSDYTQAGASVEPDRNTLLQKADLILRVRKPSFDEIDLMKEGCIYISLLDPFNEKELIDAFVDKGVSTISMEMIPRITRAQKMDVLSSQANLAGYVAVIIAAERLNKIFPMMMTPAGTIAPARVFIVGAGVAGLQAIATAKRLGAMC